MRLVSLKGAFRAYWQACGMSSDVSNTRLERYAWRKNCPMFSTECVSGDRGGSGSDVRLVGQVSFPVVCHAR